MSARKWGLVRLFEISSPILESIEFHGVKAPPLNRTGAARKVRVSRPQLKREKRDVGGIPPEWIAVKESFEERFGYFAISGLIVSLNDLISNMPANHRVLTRLAH